MVNKRLVIVKKRQNEILKSLKSGRSASVREFAEDFNVSEMTIRRDLNEMTKQGLIDYDSGKIRLVEVDSSSGLDFEIIKARRAIAQYAAQLIKEGEVIFLNASSTALLILDYLEDKNVSVFTNNGDAAFRTYPEGVRLNLIGGEVYNGIMIGDYVMENLLAMKADKTFLGCASIFTNGELRYDIPTEIGINESMITRTTGMTYVVADHNKIRSHMRGDYEIKYGSSRYEHRLTLITDDGIEKQYVKMLEDAGMDVIVVAGNNAS